MIPALDPDPESDFQPFCDSGSEFACCKMRNRNASYLVNVMRPFSFSRLLSRSESIQGWLHRSSMPRSTFQYPCVRSTSKRRLLSRVLGRCTGGRGLNRHPRCELRQRIQGGDAECCTGNGIIRSSERPKHRNQFLREKITDSFCFCHIIRWSQKVEKWHKFNGKSSIELMLLCCFYVRWQLD